VIATVLGAGSFGTALAIHLARLGHDVRLWGRHAEHLRASAEAGRNTRYLSSIDFPAGLNAVTDLEQALAETELIVSAIPTQGVKAFWQQAADHAPPNVPIVNAAKGIATDGLETIDDLLREVLPRTDAGRLAYLSGPSFALELAEGKPTLLVAASRSTETAQAVRDAFNGANLKVYCSEDVIGVELGGALKNVIAIAVGIADGMGTGMNARAGLITRGLHEINRLATRYGANPLTLAGLAGMGDLVLTCTGHLSRNRSLGFAIGEGRTPEQAIAALDGQVAEGFYTAQAAQRLAERDQVEMPICCAVARILSGEITPQEGLTELLARETLFERG
jgi:glycerol-3-phosphate dehydrogenase (NAD(P)+)